MHHQLIVNELLRQSKILSLVQMLLQVLHSSAELSDSSMQSGPPVVYEKQVNMCEYMPNHCSLVLPNVR